MKAGELLVSDKIRKFADKYRKTAEIEDYMHGNTHDDEYYDGIRDGFIAGIAYILLKQPNLKSSIDEIVANDLKNLTE